MEAGSAESAPRADLPSWRIPRLCAAILVLLGSAVLLGWAGGALALTRIHRGWPAMTPGTAMGLILVGVALLLRTVAGTSAGATRCHRASSAIALGIAGTAIYWTIQEALDPRGHGWIFTYGGTRLSPATALSALVIATALLLPRRVSGRVHDGLAIVLGAIALLNAVTYVYGSTWLAYPPMAFHTAVAMMITAIALVALRPDAPLLQLLRSEGAAGVLVRRVLPLAAAAPLISGWALLVSPLDVRANVTILAPANSLLFAGLVWWAAQVLQRSEATRVAGARQYRQVFEGTASGMLIVAGDGTIVHANQAVGEIFGFAAAELRTMVIEELLPPDHRARHIDLRQPYVRGPERRPMSPGRPLFGLHRDGHLVPVEVALSPIETPAGRMTIASVNDLTTRRQAEAAQAAQHERFLMLTRATQDTVWDWDVPTDRIWLSDNVEHAYGWPAPSDATRSWIRERVHPDDLPKMAASFASLDHPSSTMWSCEYRFRCRDGRYRDVLLRALILHGPDGQMIRLIGTMFDMTDHIAIEQALRDRTLELERSNAELERFAQIASHDLQEPLRTVSSFVQLLSKRYGDRLDETGHRYMAYAVDGANRMRTLIEALLTYSRIERRESAVTAEVSLPAVLTRVLADLRVAIQECGAQITFDPLPVVLGNEVQLAQLLINLLGNAIKYRREVAPRVHLGVGFHDGHWQLSVRDNGIGIEPRYFERIFVVFQRLHTREAYDGTGIGLAICKRIVERHGGRIWVESVPGEGSTFYFTLKRVEGAEDAEHVA